MNTSHWDLWILRALQPAAELTDLEALFRARQEWRRQWRELPDRILAGDRKLIAPGRELLAGDPSLRLGVLLTLQLGPYPCVLEPFLAAGLSVTVLASERCAARLRPQVRAMARSRQSSGRLKWLSASMPPTAAGRKLKQAVRDGGPVVVFVDDLLPALPGGDACAADRLVNYRLPGREIWVSTSLARWLCREEVPVHPVALRWREDDGGIAWSRQAAQRWTARHDPEVVTQLLHDWVFYEVMAASAQWFGWPMLVSAILAAADRNWGAGHASSRVVPQGLREDYRRAFRLCLDRAASQVTVQLEADLAVWPEGILADLTGDHFYEACGLGEQDLELLSEGAPSLAELDQLRGRLWVESHVLRLCLLGLARLRTVDRPSGRLRWHLDQNDVIG